MKECTPIFHAAGVRHPHNSYAEHEWGIEELLSVLGVPSPHLRADENPEFGLGRHCIAATQALRFVGDTLTSEPESEYGYATRLPTETCWSQSGFAVIAKTPEQKKMLETIKAESTRGGLAVVYGTFPGVVDAKGHVVSGLHLIVGSLVKRKDLKSFENDHRQLFQVRKRWVDAGGEKAAQACKKAGKNWYSLGSCYSENAEGTQTTWLNPQEQHLYRAGWFTVQDLRDWAQNKGKIIK